MYKITTIKKKNTMRNYLKDKIRLLLLDYKVDEAYQLGKETIGEEYVDELCEELYCISWFRKHYVFEDVFYQYEKVNEIKITAKAITTNSILNRRRAIQLTNIPKIVYDLEIYFLRKVLQQ